jgi:ferredoxin
MKTNIGSLKKEISVVAEKGCMDFMGIAPTELFNGVHHRMRPEAHLKEAKTVVSIGIRYPLAMYENAGRTKAESYMSMEMYENNAMETALLQAAMDVVRKIEDFGYRGIPITTKMYRVQPYKDIEGCWTQDFRNDVAAVAAGHGEIGINGVVITPKYGTRQMFTSVVTDAPIETDKMYEGSALCDKCMKCISACKMNALDSKNYGEVVVGERKFPVAKKDIWRCMWSKKFMLNAEMGPKLHGLNVTIEPPKGEITEDDVRKALSEKGQKGGLQTWYTYSMRECERECVPPHLRGVDLVKKYAKSAV